MNSMTSYQVRRHPVLAFLAFMIFGPYLLAAALLFAVLAAALYLIGALAYVASGRRIV